MTHSNGIRISQSDPNGLGNVSNRAPRRGGGSRGAGECPRAERHLAESFRLRSGASQALRQALPGETAEPYDLIEYALDFQYDHR
jgi:hypothetical protein